MSVEEFNLQHRIGIGERVRIDLGKGRAGVRRGGQTTSENEREKPQYIARHQAQLRSTPGSVDIKLPFLCTTIILSSFRAPCSTDEENSNALSIATEEDFLMQDIFFVCAVETTLSGVWEI